MIGWWPGVATLDLTGEILGIENMGDHPAVTEECDRRAHGDFTRNDIIPCCMVSPSDLLLSPPDLHFTLRQMDFPMAQYESEIKLVLGFIRRKHGYIPSHLIRLILGGSPNIEDSRSTKYRGSLHFKYVNPRQCVINCPVCGRAEGTPWWPNVKAWPSSEIIPCLVSNPVKLDEDKLLDSIGNNRHGYLKRELQDECVRHSLTKSASRKVEIRNKVIRHYNDEHSTNIPRDEHS